MMQALVPLVARLDGRTSKPVARSAAHALQRLVAAAAMLLAAALPVAANGLTPEQLEGLTRAELAGLYQSLSGVPLQPPPCVEGNEMFDDVPASNQFCPFIEELTRRGITNGCGGGNFCPGDPVTRAQMATFIVTALEATEDCNTGLADNDEMVRVGSICVDKYEASIWTERFGGSQITGPLLPCAANGQDCKDKIFARSVAGVLPRTGITWFQAQAALENSGKRLPTSAEWQMAVAGTPDGPLCNVSSGGPITTGFLPGCVSDHDVFDMVGNVWEWVADWVPASTHCPDWDPSFSDDTMCLSGASTTEQSPGALIRGGYWGQPDPETFTDAGPFAIRGASPPSLSSPIFGFRGAR